MADHEVEAVARAIARAQRPTATENPAPDVEAVSEQHRDLARLAIATLERHRSSRGASDRCCEEQEQAAADCPSEA
jgi:hypothetical protein